MKTTFTILLFCTFALAQENYEEINLKLSAEQKLKMQSFKAEMDECQTKAELKILSILDDEQKIKFLQMKRPKSSPLSNNIQIHKTDLTK